MYSKVPKLFIPLFYFDQSIPATDELASLLIKIQNLPEASNIAVLILVTLGLASLVWAAINMYCWSKKKHKSKLKIHQNNITVEEIPLRC